MKRDKRRRRGDEFISVNKPERVWRGGPGYEKHRDGRGGEGAEILEKPREHLQMRRKKQTRRRSTKCPCSLPASLSTSGSDAISGFSLRLCVCVIMSSIFL